MSVLRKLPDGWRWAKLGEVCQLNPRKPPEVNRTDDAPATFVPMAAVNAITGMATTQERPYSEVCKGYTYFADDDVLFAKITPCMQNGKHFIARNARGGFGFASTEFHVLRCGEQILPQWAHFYIRQKHILAEAVHHFTGTAGQKRLPGEYLQNLDIPLPPLAEQGRIVKLLNRQMPMVQEMRVAAEDKVAALRLLPSALLREVFCYAEKDKLPEGWQLTKLGEVILDMKDGGTPPRKNPDNFGGDINWCVVKDIRPEISRTKETLTKQGLQNCSAKVWQAGAVIISLGATIGNVGIAKIPVATKQGLSGVVVNPEKITPEYLYYVLRHNKDFILSIASGTTIKEVRPSRLQEKLIFPLPPLPEQRQAVKLLNRQLATVEKAQQAADEELDAINALPGALLRRAFAVE